MNSESSSSNGMVGNRHPDDAELRPLPMEDPERYAGYWTRLGLTLKLAFTRPMEFFERVPQGNSVRSPLGFALLLSAPFYLFLCLYPALFGLMALVTRVSSPDQAGQEPPFHWMALGCLGVIVLLPLLQIAGMLIGGLVLHLSLRVWGVHAQEIPIEQDSRASIYAHGFLALSFLTPLGPVAGLAVIVVAGMGFAKMHRAPAWRGVVAALSPALLILVGLVMIPLLLVLNSQPRAPIAPQKYSSAGPIPAVDSKMTPDEATEVHVDQVRIFLNSLSHNELSPEETIAEVIKSPTFAYPSTTNPFGGQESPIRQGLPQAMGEVGLIPIREREDSRNESRFRTGVLIIGRRQVGEIRRVIQLQGSSFRSMPEVPKEYRRP